MNPDERLDQPTNREGGSANKPTLLLFGVYSLSEAMRHFSPLVTLRYWLCKEEEIDPAILST